jgi:hypothetical protein
MERNAQYQTARKEKRATPSQERYQPPIPSVPVKRRAMMRVQPVRKSKSRAAKGINE